jgi:hypothetical protein
VRDNARELHELLGGLAFDAVDLQAGLVSTINIICAASGYRANALGRYAALLESTERPFGLHFYGDACGVAEAGADELRHGVGVGHSRAEEACAALFRQTPKYAGEALLEAEVEQPMHGARLSLPWNTGNGAGAPVCLVEDEHLELLCARCVLAAAKEKLLDATRGADNDVCAGLEEALYVLRGGGLVGGDQQERGRMGRRRLIGRARVPGLRLEEEGEDGMDLRRKLSAGVERGDGTRARRWRTVWAR